MAVDSEMQAELVRTRLTALEHLLDDVDSQFAPLRSVRDLQGTTMWTNIAACRSFADEYTRTLVKLEAALTAIRANVQALLVNLALSARDLTRTEEDIRDRMVALAEKLNTMPVTVTPTQGAGVPVATSAGGLGVTLPGVSGSESALA